MAITKKKLAEQALRIIQGGSVRDDSEIDIREIMMNIEQERDRLIKAELFQSISMGEYNINGAFISTYVSSISDDIEKDMKYSNIPVTPMSLPNDLGMFQVSFEKDQFNTFVRIPNGATGLYNNLNSSRLLGRIGYFVESSLNSTCESSSGTRVYYTNMPKDCTKSVLLKVVATSENIGEDDPFPIAPEMESQIIRSVVELYSVMRQALADESNDNVE
tara:strand:- start:20065 stop:20718 length:654 start_codon:yes stop_codon:yes gene_type:complete